MSAELDPAFRYALKLLHSSSADSTEKIRNSLDEVIKQRHGSSKMLANTLSKKYLAEEISAPGVVQRHRSSDSKASSSNSPKQQITVTGDNNSVVTDPIVISVPDDDDDDDLMEEAHLQEFQDLNCVVCRRIESSAKNRLIECTDCQSLYHQECHSPQISESDANENDSTWCCSNCKNKVKSSSVASPAKSSCSTSSSSSSSYHNKHVSSKTYEPSVTTVPTKSSSKSGSSKHKSSSSKHSSKTSHSSNHQSIVPSSNGGGGSSGLTKTPVTINIISADKRLQNMKKKAAKMHETRRKHK